MEKTLYTQEDRTIVEASQRLSQQFDLKFKPGRVSWVRVPSIRLYSSDYCVFDNSRIFVPLTLRGRLDSAEWTTLIAPSIIFANDARIKWRYRLATLFFVPYILGGMTLGSFIGFRVLHLQAGSVSATLFSVVFLSLFLAFFIFTSNTVKLYTKKIWLSADRGAVPLVGRQKLLEILKKIDAMKLADIEDLKNRSPSVWNVWRKNTWRPSIAQRIDDLQTSPSRFER